ncbi:hypothetical protein KBA27_03025 [bacterium]|nr:hypothetical protein [bacterium]
MNIQNLNSTNFQKSLLAQKSQNKNQTLPIKNAPKTSNNVSFGSGLGIATSQGLRSLATNMALGAIVIDILCMDLPRTAVDFTRSPSAGAETAIREGAGTGNHAAIGAYGLGVAAVAAAGLNKMYGVKANDIFASNETIDTLGTVWGEEIAKKKASATDATKVEKPLKEYLTRVLDDIQTFKPDAKKSDWVNIPKDAKNSISEKLEAHITKMASKEGVTKDETAKLESFIKSTLGYSTGSDSLVRFKSAQTGFADAMGSGTFISNITKLTNTFMSDKVHKIFVESKEVGKNEFLNGLKNLNKKVSIGGIALGSLIGMSIQPLNKYITKKRTGSDDFVGGGKADKSFKFKLKKLALGTAFALGAIATVTTHPSKLLSKIQFKGLAPTIDQFKVVYGLTIASRLFAARTDDELRESTIKDTLGFANWLILGNVVSIGVAKGIEKLKGTNFLKYHNSDKKSWLLHSDIMSRDEVLYDTLKKEGINTIKSDGTAMSFKEMMNSLDSLKGKNAELAKSKLKWLNVIQMAGYLYSGVVLGWALPKLNIAIKNYKDKKRAEAESLKEQGIQA